MVVVEAAADGRFHIYAVTTVDEGIESLTGLPAGNYRVLMTMGADLLAHGMAREVEQLDEKLYLELYQPRRPVVTSKKKARV